MPSQLAPDRGRAGEPAKHDGGPHERAGRKCKGNKIQPGEGQTAEDTGIGSAALGNRGRSTAVAALRDPSTDIALPIFSTRAALLAFPIAALLAFPIAALLDFSIAALLDASPVTAGLDLWIISLLSIVSRLPIATVPLDLLVDLLGRRRVLLQGGVKELRARDGR
jgi:hypothetical protein